MLKNWVTKVKRPIMQDGKEILPYRFQNVGEDTSATDVVSSAHARMVRCATQRQDAVQAGARETNGASGVY